MEDNHNQHSISSDSISYDSISSESFQEQPVQGNIVSRVAGGAYNATTTIIGGAKNVAVPVLGNAAWFTGAALTTSFGVVKSVGSYVVPARFKPAGSKDKSD
ncbi:uncharacterized protein LOC130612219 [Hydractinia symbiolongicarpus]|uniref:uncharacterized protein LOC130612219 n=1 Tax=Hydractinia symbiolongicarpus TaxID=13093 RepID=UPI002549FFCE|nr:uncharacterized protein LOC130612219 [Hydractinia symbiolongicarpus]